MVAGRAILRPRQLTSGPFRVSRLLAMTAGAILASGCGAGSGVLSARLDDGRTVAEVLPSVGAAAVIVYDVRTCMTCGVALPLWRSLMRDSTVAVRLILVGNVTEQDRKILRLQRIHIAGTIAPNRIAIDSLPAEYLFADGKLHAQAVGRGAVRNRRLWAHLAPLASSLSARASVATSARQ
jgi:hypothetical protein